MPQRKMRSLRLRALTFIGCLFLGGLSFSKYFQSLTAPLQTQPPFISLSAAGFETNLTAEGIAAGFGSNLAPGNATATATPLPTTLNGVTVTVNGVNAGLFFVSTGQINYQVPLGTAAGEATVNVLRNGAITHTGKLTIVSAAPTIFTANGNGLGVPAAVAMRVAANGAQTTEAIAQLVNNRWATKPVNLGPANERVILALFVCGVRGLPNTDGNTGNGVAENVRVLLGGLELTPSFAAKQGGLVGVDQINVEIPRALLGRGKVKLAVQGGNFVSNEAEIEIAGLIGSNPPTITSFAPALATAGETLNVNGSGFSAVAANNVVLINGLEAVVESASANQLIVRVPLGAESGRVAVRTIQGEGSSANTVTVRTTLSGLVTDTNGNPLPGVEVSVGAIKATTRNDGTYLLRDLSAGLGTLKFDPSKLPLTPPMQVYSKIVTVTANRDNLQANVALQPVTGEAVSVQTQGGGAADVNDWSTHRLLAPEGSVTSGGVTFTFADNTVGTFPPGVTGNLVFLTLIANSRTPAPLPAGIFSSAIAQLSPFGVKLAPGGKLTFPNPDGLAANAAARLYKLDQTTGSATLGQFIEAGTATVSADGTRVETGANTITETSVYFAALPRALTTVTGRVVDSDNTTPVRRALVRVRGQETVTDGNGASRCATCPSRPITNSASKPASSGPRAAPTA
ncbi:MAG: IPT/TIG domain-containing protein [Acidobacteria bacterium]|nr:IPT/TIG domain-containing protein [Acidobacteriota bacterium]MBI3423908.1 IPT/TIG domain-containing protein [Acidobacteriota bacterium]